MKRILIIDDDIELCMLLSSLLQHNKYSTQMAHTAGKGVALFKSERFDAVLCDYRLGGKDGSEVLSEIRAVNDDIPVIFITGYADLRTAIDLMKAGARDYIAKPLVPQTVLDALASALEQGAVVQPSVEQPVKEAPPERRKADEEKAYAYDGFIIGKTPAMQQLFEQAQLIAPTNYSVILYGESGTGKEVMAQFIHRFSNRRNKPFLALDCGTLSKELAMSELFGHVKGSFTGALSDKEGYFERANGGTLFLDEVGNLSYDIQVALLRVLQERTMRRVGDTRQVSLDVRIIVASNENLLEASRYKGNFREDLYHRLNEFSMSIPPLRERKADIPLFVDYFLSFVNKELGKDIRCVTPEVLVAFHQYKWPGNLREFRNVMRRAALLTEVNQIELKHLAIPEPRVLVEDRFVFPGVMATGDDEELDFVPPPPFAESSFEESTDLKEIVAKAEYNFILKVLEKVQYNKKRAAQILKIDRKTLYNKLKYAMKEGEGPHA